MDQFYIRASLPRTISLHGSPLYDAKMDDAPNYGDTGSNIGHELTHGFDDLGRQFVWKMKEPSTGLIREPKMYVMLQRTSCLWWVAEKKTGGGRNEALVFTGIEAYKCTYFLAYSVELLNATYDTLNDLGQTPFLSEISAQLKGRTNIEELKHFAISFDDGPLFEFIARGFEFRSPFDPMRSNYICSSVWQLPFTRWGSKIIK